MDSPLSIDPTRCPVCGASNSCVGATGSSEACWCSSVEITAEALARIPEAAKDIACLCPRCAAFVAPRAKDEARAGTK